MEDIYFVYFLCLLELFSKLFWYVLQSFEYLLINFLNTVLNSHNSCQCQFKVFSILMDTFVSNHPSTNISAHDGRYKDYHLLEDYSVFVLFGVVSLFVLLVNKHKFCFIHFLNISTFSALLFIGRTNYYTSFIFCDTDSFIRYSILKEKGRAVVFPVVSFSPLVIQMYSLLESGVFPTTLDIFERASTE